MPTEIKYNIVLDNIRTKFDHENYKWYFSVSDVLNAVVDTTDSRNYWKVLKNRLKKEHNELVTSCNQLKMPGSDGKMYQTDVADSETLLQIVQIVAPAQVLALEEFLHEFDKNEAPKEEEIELKLMIDLFQDDKNLYLKTMLAGVSPGDIHISVTANQIEILGKRKKLTEKNVVSMMSEELLWGAFARVINLPHDVETDSCTTEFVNGLLTIVLPKIDKKRKKILKVK